MVSQLIRIEVDLCDSLAQLEQAIEMELQKQGEPIRWVVLDVDKKRQKVYVEAIVVMA
ncbi:hypothetical protein ACN4EK_00190 [Pantanalinema rosaneae CENA516]|uniref:hypothetical protein n=1 Tax=Pantanalinema rosaneae TaxID=1620701 RepID=UPI003D6E5AE1